MEKIVVNPLEVRGQGDIVSPKSTGDFEVHNTLLAESTDTVNGVQMSVFTESYLQGTYMSRTANSFIKYGVSLTSMNFVIFLRRSSNNTVISGASVSCTVNGDTVLTGTTDSNGRLQFSIPFVPGVSLYRLKIRYDGTDSIGGCTVNGVLVVGTMESLLLTGDKEIIRVDEDTRVTSFFTGSDVNGDPMGIPYSSVNIYDVIDYEQEVTSLGVAVDTPVVALLGADSTSVVSVSVLDQHHKGVAGQTVTFMKGSTVLGTADTNGYGVAEYTYTSSGAGDVTITAECGGLSGTGSIEDCLTAKVAETTVSNSGGTKISSVGLDTVYNIQNTDFSLEFDSKGNGVLNIGAKDYWSSSSANYRATIGYADGKNYWSTRTTSTTEGYGSNASTSTEYHYKITREGTTVKFYVNDSLIQTSTFSSFSSYSSWSIYSIIWGSGTQNVKNIKLKPL